MTKEEYVAKVTKLKKECIASNSPIKPGTKVKVTIHYRHLSDDVTYGILTGYTCNFDEVLPVVAKIKKDGTQSKKNVWIPNNWKYKIEVCDE
jgi:hypothetical protein